MILPGFSMSKKILGVDLDGSVLKISLLQRKKDKILLRQVELFDKIQSFEKLILSLRSEGDLYIVSSIKASSVLTKTFQIPLTKKREVEKALPFQLEGAFPFEVSEASIATRFHRLAKQTSIRAFAVTETTLKSHIQEFGKIQPDFVTSEIVSLAKTGMFLTQKMTQLCVHLGDSSTTFVATANGDIIASSSISLGYKALYKALTEDFHNDATESKIDEALKDLQLESITQDAFPTLHQVVLTFKKECERSIYYLLNMKEGRQIESFIFTGHHEILAKFAGFIETILDISLKNEEKKFSAQENKILSFAIAFGSALEIVQEPKPIEFKQVKNPSPYLVSKLKKNFICFVSLSGVLSLLCFGIGTYFVKNYEKHLDKKLTALAARYAHQHPKVLQSLSTGSLSFYQKLKIAKKAFGKSVKPSRLYDSFPMVSQTIENLYEVISEKAGIELLSLDYELKKYPDLDSEESEYEVYTKIGVQAESKQIVEEFRDCINNIESFRKASNFKLIAISGNRYEIEFTNIY